MYLSASHTSHLVHGSNYSLLLKTFTLPTVTLIDNYRFLWNLIYIQTKLMSRILESFTHLLTTIDSSWKDWLTWKTMRHLFFYWLTTTDSSWKDWLTWKTIRNLFWNPIFEPSLCLESFTIKLSRLRKRISRYKMQLDCQKPLSTWEVP